jgi:hypothetical protein
MPMMEELTISGSAIRPRSKAEPGKVKRQIPAARKPNVKRQATTQLRR